ncbi:MAG: hypothetical protein KAS62_07305 [Candidatus Delongbacteria bacterium]|nr:hypothetical protein [Candidatus Delongbacteria bacterium]
MKNLRSKLLVLMLFSIFVSASYTQNSGSMMDDFFDNDEKDSKADTTEVKVETEINMPEIDFDKDTKKLSVDYYQKLDSDSVRVCWLETGGFLLSQGLTCNITHASMDMDGDDFTLNGFGVSYLTSVKFISPPNYLAQKDSWNAYSYGFGFSENAMFGSVGEMQMSMLALDFSLPLGYTFGVGKYLSQYEWKGIMIGVFWKPTYSITYSSVTMPNPFGSGDWTFGSWDDSFNFRGFQWSFDFGDFDDMAEELAQEAHFTINGFILPETDSTPFMFSLGIGAVWY